MRSRALMLIAAAPIAACSLEPRDARPASAIPPSWPAGDAYLAQTEAALPSVNYRDVLKDPRLQAIVDQALANNRDLRIAAANILAARATFRVQRAALFPEIDAVARFSRSEGGAGANTIASSSTGSGGTTGSEAGSGTGSGSGTGTGSGAGATTGTATGASTSTTGATTGAATATSVPTTGAASTAYSLDLASTSFELDLFGRIRSLTRAAQDQYFAQEATARATRLTLVATVANDWLQYAADSSLLQIAQQTADAAAKEVQLTQARLTGGIAPRTDLTQAQGVLFTAQSDFAAQRTLVAQDVNALQLVVGAPVDPALLPATIQDAAGRIAGLPAGVTSEVLLRRPDVVQAEYALRAANAQIGAARAALFPRISLTALVGLSSASFGNLFTGAAFSSSVAPSVSYPIFRAGAAKANVAYARAEREVALDTYERTIQMAFREVSDALARRGTIADQLTAQQRNVDAAADTLRLTDARYRGGIAPYLNTLDAQRTLYTAQRTYVATALAGGENLVRLYQVLGGDSTLDAAGAGPRPVTAPSTPP